MYRMVVGGEGEGGNEGVAHCNGTSTLKEYLIGISPVSSVLAICSVRSHSPKIDRWPSPFGGSSMVH